MKYFYNKLVIDHVKEPKDAIIKLKEKTFDLIIIQVGAIEKEREILELFRFIREHHHFRNSSYSTTSTSTSTSNDGNKKPFGRQQMITSQKLNSDLLNRNKNSEDLGRRIEHLSEIPVIGISGTIEWKRIETFLLWNE